MSTQIPKRPRRRDLQRTALVFAALGDTTRLRLLEQLGSKDLQSITQLSAKMPVTRQAVTKHLRVLERAKLVTQTRCGRENKFRVVPTAVNEARTSLQTISRQWDEALQRLKAHVENEGE